MRDDHIVKATGLAIAKGNLHAGVCQCNRIGDLLPQAQRDPAARKLVLKGAGGLG